MVTTERTHCSCLRPPYWFGGALRSSSSKIVGALALHTITRGQTLDPCLKFKELKLKKFKLLKIKNSLLLRFLFYAAASYALLVLKTGCLVFVTVLVLL